MSQMDRLLKRVRQEITGRPGITLQELARKFTVPEGAILEALRDGAVQKVRRELRDALLAELPTWGLLRLQVRNDWAECEVACDGREVEVEKDGLILESVDRRLRVARSSIESMYFVEEGGSQSLRVFNRRGRFVFQVGWPSTPEAGPRFKETRARFCR
jgi:hypothetical protein